MQGFGAPGSGLPSFGSRVGGPGTGLLAFASGSRGCESRVRGLGCL